MSPQNNHLQRPPAAVLYADELAKLKQNDNAPCPPGWQLSLPAARAFILGDSAQNISRKVVISPLRCRTHVSHSCHRARFDVGGGTWHRKISPV
ncbi:ATPase [Escherichia coli]|uniref:ATPase n=1 Tax=Escherichia coli TaxID=562 RepID=A0A2X3JKU5_ECOLX|nr:ATPase [Escherichia coli]